MSRQRSDPHETRPNLGPLFPDPARITKQDGPATSRKAAGRVIADGTAKADGDYLVDLVTRFEGHTLVWYGTQAVVERGGTALEWRLKLGRRTGDVSRRIHSDGEQDGMGRWWKGPKP